MQKKIIVYSLLALFVNYLVGCSVTKQERILPAESYDQKITRAILSDGLTVTFDEFGGKVISPDSSLVTMAFGDPAIIELRKIAELRTKASEFIPRAPDPDKKIFEVINKKNKLLRFHDEGGVYIPEQEIIRGRDEKGKLVEIPLSDVSYISTTKPETVTPLQLIEDNSIKISQVVFHDNTVRTFGKNKAYFVKEDYVVIGVNTAGELTVLPEKDVLYVEVEKADVAGSCLATFGIGVAAAAVVVVIIAATKQSCPFIYSYDGSNYVFDAEPLGGATSEIYKRGELSRLDYLKESDGKYKLMVTNEVNETQYIDALNMQYIDHSSYTKIYPDYNGNYYLINNPVEFVSAYNENGDDLSLFLEKDDASFWMTNMLQLEELKEKIRNQLTVVFPKPHNADSVNLVINAGTTLWGSNMIREMLNMYGSSVEDYYKRINEGGFDYQQTMKFLLDEELYQLRMYVKTGKDWIYKGLVNGGGPLITETRVIPLNISDIEGDSLIIKFNPPVGFWTFGSLAVDYSLNKAEFNSLDLTDVRNPEGESILETLMQNDGKYYVMPEKGMKFFAEFEAPPVENGLVRSVFSNTVGWYKIHLDYNGPARTDLLYKLVSSPGNVVKFSSEEYFKWYKNLSAKGK